MSKQELEITILKDGNIDISVNNAVGKECVDMTKSLEEALGNVIKKTFKPEYYQDNETHISQNRECRNIHKL